MDIQATLQPLFDKLDSWLDGAIALLPNLTVALVALVAFYLGSQLANRVARRVGSRVATNQAIVRLLASVVQYSVLATGFVVALGIIGLQKAVVSILAGAGVAGLAVGFAFQDLAANFIAGVGMGIRQPFQIGHLIKTSDYLGHVETINLRNTIIRSLDGERVIVPNRMVFENPLVNYHSYGTRRVEIEVGVAYDTSLSKATSTAKNAIEALDYRADGTEVEVVSEGFGASSIDFLVRFWIPFPGHDYFGARHDGILAIKQAFDDEEISIPFPIRTLDLSGVQASDGALPFRHIEAESTAA